MAFKQDHLSPLGHRYHEFAEAIAGKKLNPSYTVAALEKDEVHKIYDHKPTQEAPALRSLKLLIAVATQLPYGVDRDGFMSAYELKKADTVDRENLVLVARLGGLALRQINKDVWNKNVRLSTPSLNVIQVLAIKMHKGLDEAFKPSPDRIHSDTKAIDQLDQARYILGLEQ